MPGKKRNGRRPWWYYSKQTRKKKSDEKRRIDENITRSVLQRIPERVADLFPEARKMKRKFILHLGPTNSGKTYQAVQGLIEAGTGIYLAPLRLLAYEQYENLNSRGHLCSLITGEERDVVPYAMFTAATVEMADLEHVFEAAVIDEAQMVADQMRGGAWTSAILGLMAKTIHLCAAPTAEEVLVRMIEECGDEYEIRRYERMTPLVVQTKKFAFPQDVQDGDALIVFSKANVHGVAAELQRNDISCSIIYGALPYNVRHEEARRFAEGETRIVVATDAIGMGMNLPIRRIVFLEVSKYDGFSRRLLQTEEIKQIAGRAGRRGIFNQGFVTSISDRKLVRAAVRGVSEPVHTARIGFPEALVTVEGPLLTIIQKWGEMIVQAGYDKEDVQELITLCEYAEPIVEDKQVTYDLITLPFDTKEKNIMDLWRGMVRAESENDPIPYEMYAPFVDGAEENLQNLENAHKICDLAYAYTFKFGDRSELEEIQRDKRIISRKIMDILKTQQLTGRSCRRCGRSIAWDYPYGICPRCFEHRRKRAQNLKMERRRRNT